MSLTAESVKQHLQGRRFPAILTSDDYAEIIAASLRELNNYSAMTRYASFTTVDGVQDYYIFDPDNATTEGVAAGALRLRNVLWNPESGGLSLIGHELVGQCGDPSSYLKLSPVPQTDTEVILEFVIDLALEDISASVEPLFYQWVEYYTADTLANHYASTAGINLLGFKDSDSALRFWESKSRRYYERAIAIQASFGGIALRG